MIVKIPFRNMLENGAKTKTNNIVANNSASLYISFPIELSDCVSNLDHNTPIAFCRACGNHHLKEGYILRVLKNFSSRN
jgi:hypothetical protein